MTWTAPEFTKKLVADLEARESITELSNPTVRVLSYWPSNDEKISDGLIIGYEAEDNTEVAALGPNPKASPHNEHVILHCAIRITRPGAGVKQVDSARDRAAFLLGEVDAQLRNAAPAVGSFTARARIDRREISNIPSTDIRGAGTRVCLIQFQIVYMARTPAQES